MEEEKKKRSLTCPLDGAELETPEQFRAHLFCRPCRRKMVFVWSGLKVIANGIALKVPVEDIHKALGSK